MSSVTGPPRAVPGQTAASAAIDAARKIFRDLTPGKVEIARDVSGGERRESRRASRRGGTHRVGRVRARGSRPGGRGDRARERQLPGAGWRRGSGGGPAGPHGRRIEPADGARPGRPGRSIAHATGGAGGAGGGG